MKILTSALLVLLSCGALAAETFTVDVELVKTVGGRSVVETVYQATLTIDPAPPADVNTDPFASREAIWPGGSLPPGFLPHVAQFGDTVEITSGCTTIIGGEPKLTKDRLFSGTTVILHAFRNPAGLVVLSAALDRTVLDHIDKRTAKGCEIDLPSQRKQRANGHIPVLSSGSARTRVVAVNELELYVTVRPESK